MESLQFRSWNVKTDLDKGSKLMFMDILLLTRNSMFRDKF